MVISGDSASWWFVRRGIHARNVSGAWVHRRCGGFRVLRASSVGYTVTFMCLFQSTSSVGYPRFYVSQARVFVVLRACPVNVLPVEVCHGGGTVVVVDPWWYLVVVGVEVELCPVEVVCPATLRGWVAGEACSLGVVLVGLHCSLPCGCGAAVGPFVRDCETERWFLCCVVRVCHGGGIVVVVVPWWYLVVVGVEVELCPVEVV
ncbi:hypothetical protein Taro_038873, partial [Colocasia esculenta]|nr:hypothetical protein [Colocasia esculenta]